MKGLIVIVLLVALTIPFSSVYASQESNVIRILTNRNVFRSEFSYYLFAHANVSALMGINKTGSFNYEGAKITYHQDQTYVMAFPNNDTKRAMDWGIIINYPQGPSCYTYLCPAYVLIVVVYGSNVSGGIMQDHNAEIGSKDSSLAS